ncbi:MULTISPECIES: mandelate racemase/muconate lactonizing enzyme family protein [unclassified Achromobacter]|uniref:mandelate racemase/muconate lactonizing enzyme family protein n=1 Tax=unclassified Achromobacter TaxID=2626865 RepID=UPI000B518A00|nr:MULTISPECIES: mandelate racemase/muconate lactonizing enzyme family protein [unclassified Achromobacter]OWT73542.1 racemase [Achromobacter sp. HZ34]OWT79540.1 racemase [Achromobacter sp. HZ28]
MPTIESVSVCIARVPLDKPVTFSTRQVTAREYCLVRVRSTDGHEGLGYCYAVNSAGRLLSVAVTDLLAPRLVGQESLRVEGLWREMYQEALLLGRAGGVVRALSAIDIALWDLNARSAGLPLYQYLGATVDDRVPAYASGGYYLPGKTPDKLAAEMAGHVKDGFRAVKMKVGLESVAGERKRIAAVREAIGADVRLMLDANNAWRDLPTALEYMRAFEPYQPFWIEEPFSPDDIDNHVRLARATPITVATGEIEAGRWRFKDLLARDATTLLQTDATVCGGITEFRRIVATADSHGVTVAPHAWHDVHAHLVASSPNCTYVEWMPDDHIVNFRRLIDRQLQARDGQVLLPREPGLGFKFDPAAIEKYGVIYAGTQDRWQVVGGK